MSSMYTPLSICNMALQTLSIPVITSFDDAGSNMASYCHTLFPIIRDRVLRDHYWGFALHGQKLAQLNETPFDPAFQFSLAIPSDCLLVKAYGTHPYRRMGARLFTNHPDDVLIYVRRMTDTSIWDDLFCDAMRWALASEICRFQIRDPNMINLCEQKYASAIALAKSVDSQENDWERNDTYRPTPMERAMLNRGTGFGIGDRSLDL